MFYVCVCFQIYPYGIYRKKRNGRKSGAHEGPNLPLHRHIPRRMASPLGANAAHLMSAGQREGCIVRTSGGLPSELKRKNT